MTRQLGKSWSRGRKVAGSVPGVSTSARAACSGSGIKLLIEVGSSTMQRCGLYVRYEAVKSLDSSGTSSQLSFEMLNHTCTSICFWFAPSLSLPASYSPFPFPFSVLPAFLCVRGQASGRGWARTGSRDRPGNASVRSDIANRLRVKGRAPGRRWAWGGCWLPRYDTQPWVTT